MRLPHSLCFSLEAVSLKTGRGQCLFLLLQRDIKDCIL